MKQTLWDFAVSVLSELNAENGVSGRESDVADCMAKYLSPLSDEQFRDDFGNAVFIKRGKNPERRLMVTAHMDEIGLIVHDVTDDGYLTVMPVGFHNPNLLVNQVYSIHTKSGTVCGVVGGGKPIHQTRGKESANFAFSDLRLDVGASDAREVRALGIAPGDRVNIEKDSHLLNGRYFCGKAVDNRSGCAAAVVMMALLKGAELNADLYFCGTVQEEVGLKGANVLSRRINPDAAVCVDVGCASEDGAPNPNGTRCYVGKGPAIELYNWNPDSTVGNMVQESMLAGLRAAAEKADVAWQESLVLRGGTDACAININGAGILCGGISIMQKYIHTTVGLVSIQDLIDAGKILAEFSKGFQ